MAAGGWWSLEAVLKGGPWQKKKLGSLRTALVLTDPEAPVPRDPGADLSGRLRPPRRWTRGYRTPQTLGDPGPVNPHTHHTRAALFLLVVYFLLFAFCTVAMCVSISRPS